MVNFFKGEAKQSGFTLVELAIVMIVIGLLIGGILKGQELISSAQLKKTYSAVQGYRAAVYTFKDKYRAYPGDMMNAGDFLSGCAAMNSCFNAGGNGDGIVGTPNITNWSRNDQSTTNSEATQLWIHLSLAGLISGVSGQNVRAWGDLYPESPIDGGFQVAHVNEAGNNAANGHYFVLRFPATGDPHPDVVGEAVLSPQQVFELEQKYDDQIGNGGKIIADDNGSLCWAIASGRYNMQVTDPVCLTAFSF